ncbi:hypothetical protein [Parabacteroides sp. PF5-9]|uniref:hypothetical protein n=1 Tax=Parabacteroides sp. PF5-9 TaxID=1742404 RepID=UPI002477117C|nr:hypothetical protein [Parabacteroides sp. PF5-9]MDH6356391.1 hypothetical protein [Parabacteroides sp. PF5-9]
MRMTKVFTFLLFLLMITHVACDGNNESGQEIKKEEEQEQEQEPEKEPEKGVDVSFAEYTLEGTSCQWVNLHSEDDPGGHYNLLVINSDEELQKYIIGTDYPPVDFSKHTLLLASSRTNYGIAEIVNSLQELSVSKYKWAIEINLSDATMIENWVRAILVDKLSKESEVQLYINTIRN